jgi:hypothetical protein
VLISPFAKGQPQITFPIKSRLQLDSAVLFKTLLLILQKEKRQKKKKEALAKVA